jgi:hypothetical protein
VRLRMLSELTLNGGDAHPPAQSARPEPFSSAPLTGELSSQPCGIPLAQLFIALIVERLNNVPVHYRPDLALFIFRSFSRVYERAPDVDFLPSSRAFFVERQANLGNRGAQG